MMNTLDIGTPLLWTSFAVLIVVVMFIDLFLLGGRKAHTMKVREACIWSLVWVILALLFNLGMWIYLRHTQSAEVADTSSLNFLTGYLVEKALSVDNLFVFLMIFAHFKVPAPFQRRVLMYGVWGAIVMRAIMIFAGVALVTEFAWILYIFGAFLMLTGVKMLVTSEKESSPEESKLFALLQKIFRVTKTFHEERFFVRQNKLLYVTPLFIVLLFIEFSDLIFATDSIPAIFAITQDPFIIFTSNIFAIMGLRALYFALAHMMDRFHYLRYGLGVILVLIGIKLLVTRFYHVPPFVTLLAIALILLISVLASLMRKEAPKHG